MPEVISSGTDSAPQKFTSTVTVLLSCFPGTPPLYYEQTIYAFNLISGYNDCMVVTITAFDIRKLKPRLMKQFASGYMAMGGVELEFQARSLMLLGPFHLLRFGYLQVLQR